METANLQTRIINRFNQGGNNSTKTIAKELGISYYYTNKVLNIYLNGKREKK